MSGWMKHKLESRLPGEISITSDMHMTPPLWQKSEELKRLLMKVKEESEKVGLKLNLQWQPTPVFLPGKSHGQRNLVGYSPWGHKQSNMTE